MTVVVVTGTGTGVGKTVATAALGCSARLAGLPVAVCKPVQTGTDDGDDDLAEVARLSGVTALTSGWHSRSSMTFSTCVKVRASSVNLPGTI